MENNEKIKPFAVSTCDGHSEDWFYFDDEETARKSFEAMKNTESDIHLCKYSEEYNSYEVIDSYYDGL